MRLLVRIVFVILLVLSLSTPAEAAARGRPPGRLLGQLWHEVLTLPLKKNPFANGSPCLHFRGVASIFGPNSDGAVCEVRKGTRILIVGYSSECSTVEDPPFGVPPGVEENEASLRRCAQAADDGFETPTVVLDHQTLPLTRTTSRLIKAKLPAKNVFGTKERVAYAVADGWVAGAFKLRVGLHTIVITVNGTDQSGAPVHTVTTSTLRVKASKH